MSRARLIFLAVIIVATSINGLLFWLRFGEAGVSGNTLATVIGTSLRNMKSRLVPASSASVADFSLLDHNGGFHRLYRYATARAVVLYTHGIGCPIVRQGVSDLKEIRDHFVDQGVVFLMINANPQDDRKALQEDAKRLDINMPILKDESQLVIEQLKIARTGEVLVLDPRDWRIAYRGAIDDRLHYEAQKPQAEHRYLIDALSALLKDESVPIAETRAVGCAISAESQPATDKAKLTYVQDIVPILREKCIACHSPGGIGPWAMDNYETVKGWSAMMREVLMTGRMPPWHADPEIGRFQPDFSLNIEQKRMLVRWIDAGVPRGEGPDPLKIEPAAIPRPEWPLGEPDMVVEGPLQKIRAKGPMDYVLVDVPVPISQDAWLRAVQVKPSNPAVTHHIFVMIKYPDPILDKQPIWRGGSDGFFAVYVPGAEDTLRFPVNAGMYIPAGAALRFQLHYVPLGYETEDHPKVALYFCKEPPAWEFKVASVNNVDFRVPPYAFDHPVRATYTLNEDIQLFGMFPHMHIRGSRMHYEAHYADGRREPLLSVPQYHFNWQRLYNLSEPKDLPAGTKLVVTGAFDNSVLNPGNPDPSKEVLWGKQSFEEMFQGYFFYLKPLKKS